MSGNTFGQIFRVTTFGESHGPALGCVIDGCPAGVDFDLDFMIRELQRRKPGQSRVTTQRKEEDAPEVLSGVFEGRTTGTPIAIVIHNTNQRSKDYGDIVKKYRPGHADFTYDEKYGFRDYRGGGRSSARETAARVAAGAVAQMVLNHHGVDVWGFVSSVGSLQGKTVDRSIIEENPIRAADPVLAEEAFALIDSLRKEGNSVGGVVEIRANGVPTGLGEPVFDKFDAVVAAGMMSVPAVKGVEFGDGFVSATRTGLENNDRFDLDESGQPCKQTNGAGGVLGGITDGSEVIVRCALKPTSSILVEQDTIDQDHKRTTIQTKGRHDPFVASRFVPIGEAMLRLALVDAVLRQRSARL